MTRKHAILRHFQTAFSLVELMVVVSIIVALAALSGPAIRSLSGAGTVGKAIGDLNGFLQASRAYAMANNTYVRVAFADLPTNTHGRARPATLVMAIYSADGTLDASAAADMADPATWPALGKPLLVDGFKFNDALNTAATPNTGNDVSPFDSSDIARITGRKVAGISPNPSFDGFIQFNPSGEAGINKGTPDRFIKLALDRAEDSGHNPFILRLSGANGAITTLRKEDGIQ